MGDFIIPKRGKSLLSKNAVHGNVPVIAGGLEPSIYHNVANTVAPVVTISSSGANAGFVNIWGVPVIYRFRNESRCLFLVRVFKKASKQYF